MKDYIEFPLNGTTYSASIIPSGESKGRFCWSNERGEEGKSRRHPARSQAGCH